MVEGLNDGVSQVNQQKSKNHQGYLDDVQFHDHIHRSTYFMFQTVHFKAHALKNHLGTSCHRDLLEQSSNCRRIEVCRWQECVELNWQQPEGTDVVLASLNTSPLTSEAARYLITHQLHDRANGTLDVDSVISEDRDQTRRAAQSGELNIGRIIAHDSPQVFCSVSDHPVQLAGKNSCVS